MAMIERVGLQLNAIRDILRLQVVRDPQSLDDVTRKVEIKWNVWLLREGKVKEMVQDLIATKQNIAAALAAITTIFTYAVGLFALGHD